MAEKHSYVHAPHRRDETPDQTRKRLEENAGALFYLHIALIDRARRVTTEAGQKNAVERADHVARKRQSVLLQLQGLPEA